MKRTPHTFDAFRLVREQGALEGTLDVGAAGTPGRSRRGRRRARSTGASRAPRTARAGRRWRSRSPATCRSNASGASRRSQFPVAQRTVTVLARSESEADALDAESDDEVLVADHPLEPVALVEDELLLTLPFAPMHAEGACVK